MLKRLLYFVEICIIITSIFAVSPALAVLSAPPLPTDLHPRIAPPTSTSTPTPTIAIACDDPDWYCLSECANAAARSAFGGNAALWRQRKIEYTNRDNRTSYNSCAQEGPITPSIAPSNTLGVLPTGSTSPTPPGMPDHNKDCSATGWQTRFVWARPADYSANDYIFTLDHQGSIGPSWFNHDGTDIQKEISDTHEVIIDTLPRQAYAGEVKKQLSDASPLFTFPSFTCVPYTRTTVSAPCFSGDQKNALCTVDVWATDMLQANSGDIANDVIAPSSDADANGTLDLLDFERIRAASHD